MWRLLLGTMGVKSLVQGLNAAATAEFEPRTVWSEVRRRNRLATAPPPGLSLTTVWKFLFALMPSNFNVILFWGPQKYEIIVHSKKTEPWQPQLVGWYERWPLHDPNKVFAYCSKKKTTTFGAKTIVLFKNLVTGCCSQPLPSEHRCVWPLKVLLSCYWAFSGLVAVIFQGGVVG